MKIFVNLLDGLQLVNPKSSLILTFNNEYFIIEELGNKGFKPIMLNTFKIPIKKIKDTLITTEREFVEKSKSVLGRGVAGGLLFGPAGLVLGGLSGIGKKQKTITNYFYIISFDSVEGEVKNITFTVPVVTVSAARKFDKLMKENFEPQENHVAKEQFL